jgi:UDP-2,3-diacylglucosamine hydrolase
VPAAGLRIADGPAALLGDAHLREDDREVEAFVVFLDTLPADIRTLAILGDLFAVWIGSADLERPHHVRVVDALRRLRGRGCRLIYVEGNHDYDLRRRHGGTLFDLFDETALDGTLAGRRAHLAHGDLVNTRDRQYLTWRAVSKSRPFLAAYGLLPAGLRQRIAARLEASLARTNLEHRRGFPVEECALYARARIAAGTDCIVLGHFHEERRFDYESGGRRGSVFVLPAWRSGHRYLRIDPGSEPRFVSASTSAS